MRNSIMFKFLYLFLLCFIPLYVFAQKAKITGTVKEDNGEPMVGVAVVGMDGQTKVGTQTDIDGKYEISVNPKGTLRFTFLGYEEVEVNVEGKTTINAVMKMAQAQELESVVVVAFGTQKKVTLTGSVANLGGEELIRSPAPSLANSISGRIPGVQTVQYSGRPGADDPQIFIRGVNTLSTSGAQPLVLVDGVERSFTQIDPNEVADISVLKDASATAVFGVRGANGVILVTTKRGQLGKTSVEASASYGWQSKVKFVSFADSYTYAKMYNYTQLTDGVDPKDLRFDETALNHFRLQDQPLLYPSINWMDYIMKDYAPQTQYNVNVTGGNEKAKFFTSIGILNQDGLFNSFDTDPNMTFKYNRYNYRANLDLDLSKYHFLSISLGGRVEQTNDIGLGEEELFKYLMAAAPFAGAGIIDGKRIIANERYVGKTNGDALWRYYGLGYKRDTKNVLNLDLQYRLKMDFITQGLNFSVKGSYNSDYTKRKERTSGRPSYRPIEIDGENGEKKIVLERMGDSWPLSYGNESSWFGRNWYAETSLNYARSFGNHNVTALFLYNQSKTYYPAQYSDIPTGYVGLVGRVTYNYATKYLLDVNAGYNGSENFAPGRRYGLFPSASLGWIISSENFMKGQSLISYLKFRVSIGKVGNDRMGDSRFLYLPDSYEFNYPDPGKGNNYYKETPTYQFGTTNNTWFTGVYENKIGNPAVSWETSLKQNAGFDMKIFKDCLSVNFDIFKEHRTNILINNSSLLAAPSAQKPVSINYGIVDSWGYELQVTWADKIGDFNYSFAPFIAFSRNKVIEKAEVPQVYPWLQTTGLPVGQPFGYEFFELYEPGKTETKYKGKYGKEFPNQVVANSNLKRGDATYVDLNDDGKIDSYDRHAIGHPDYPEYTFGANIFLSFKGFDLSMTWSGVTNSSRLLMSAFRPQFGEQKIDPLLQWVADNSWTETNTNAVLPRISFANESQNTATSRIWLVDASYLRLKNMELGYNFKNIIPAVKGLRVFVNGTNLLTFSSFKGNDPENDNVRLKYPMMRLINIGARITF